ncbi:torsin-1A-interacting protein 2 isoform X2 [Neoarius graeffei]|uniref:torsin-1A-interacting protein 2 isoform X2 n=1 Tax=Neoarius graeffei TaxID=443677 RepID=UPI00298D4E59|nr:torsin-1A-interacting protein 2 isoform X2 [Neoarius graeffei]
MNGDTNQTMDDDIRQHNLPKKIKKGGNGDRSNSEEEEECYTDDGLDTEQPEDTRMHNQQKDAGVSGQSDVECEDFDTSDGKRVKDKNENNEVPYAGDGPRSRRSNNKQEIGLDTEQPEDTRMHNQQKDAGVSGQSDVECEDFDTSDGKRVKDKNENNEVPYAGDGPRSRRSNNKQEIGLDTEQPEDTRMHNQQKDAGVSGQSDVECEDFDTSDGKRVKDKNENNEVPYAGDGPRSRRSNNKQEIGLDTEQPEDTRMHNQQKDAGVSGQSDVECEDFDTSDGKRVKDKKENNEVPYAGDGPRSRRSNNKQEIVRDEATSPKGCCAHPGEGDTCGHVETKKSPVVETSNTGHITWYVLPVILLSLPVVVWFLNTPSPSLQKEFNLLEVFCQEMDKVQATFPSQHRELWRRSRIHLQKHLNLTDPTEPVSVILTSGRGAETTLGCLAQQLAAAFSNALNSSVLDIDGTSKSAQDSDQVKLDIDKALKEAFEGGTQAAVVHRFEELPPGSTLIFYRYCDHENAAFKKVFLVFTVMLQEDVDFPSNISLGMVEEAVQEYLKEKFVSSDRMAKFNQMDLDKLSGLWSRISHLILPVAAEQNIEQRGCQT